jgi:hypothetical protein
MSKQVKNKTKNGIVFTTENTSKIKASAVMAEVNKSMNLYAAELPAHFRGSVMSVLYGAIAEGGLRVATITSKTGPNAGNPKVRHLLKAGTTLTPYVSTTSVGDGRRNIKDRNYNTGGVNMEYFLKNLCKLYVEGGVNLIKGVSEEQLTKITKSSLRTYKINGEDDSVKEILKVVPKTTSK